MDTYSINPTTPSTVKIPDREPGKPIIVDGSLTRTVHMDETRYFGNRLDPNWAETDAEGHRHDAAGLHSSTYQPTEDVYCDEHGEVEDRAVGGRRCIRCDAELHPNMIHGYHTVADPVVVWSVEYLGPHMRALFTNVPESTIQAILDSGAIEPHLDVLAERGPRSWEMWS